MEKSIDVFIPCRNNAKTIVKTINSIYSQNYIGFKYIYLLDNNSTDNSVEIVRKNFPDIKIFLSEIDLNASENYSRAFNLAKSEFFTICHSDDIYLPFHFENLISILNTEDSSLMCYSATIAFDNLTMKCLDIVSPRGGQLKISIDNKYYQKFKRDNLIKELLLNGNNFSCPSIIYKREVIQKLNFIYGMNKKKYIDTDDLYNLLEISKFSDICISLIPTLLYRRSIHSVSFKKSLTFNFSKSHLIFLKDLNNYPIDFSVKIRYLNKTLLELIKSIYKLITLKIEEILPK